MDRVIIPSVDRLLITDFGELGVTVEVVPYQDLILLAENGDTLTSEGGIPLLSEDAPRFTEVVVED